MYDIDESIDIHVLVFNQIKCGWTNETSKVECVKCCVSIIGLNGCVYENDEKYLCYKRVSMGVECRGMVMWNV